MFHYKRVFHWHLNTIPSPSFGHNAEKMCFFNTTSAVAPTFKPYQNISIKPHTHEVYNCSFSSSFLVESETPERESHLTLSSMVNLFNTVSRLKWLEWKCLGKYQRLGRRPMMLWFMVSLLHLLGKIPVWISALNITARRITYFHHSHMKTLVGQRGIYTTLTLESCDFKKLCRSSNLITKY